MHTWIVGLFLWCFSNLLCVSSGFLFLQGAVAGYFGGFAFWSFENTYCASLPNWVQFHALWHIMAGLGTFCAVQCQIAWRAEELGGKTAIDMELGGQIMPIVVVKYD
jgi:hypothetical protein